MTYPFLREIIEEVARDAGVTPDRILAVDSKRGISRVRRVAMWACRTVRGDASLPKIGRAFNRHHTTVLAAVRKVEVERKTRPGMDQACARIAGRFLDVDA